MIITIDDAYLLKFAGQVQEELEKYRDHIPDTEALAKAMEILINEKIYSLTTDPEAWVYDLGPRQDLEIAAWEQQRLAEREARTQLQAEAVKLAA
jgi:uncharacterized membrane protein